MPIHMESRPGTDCYLLSDETAVLALCPCCGKPFNIKAATAFKANAERHGLTLKDMVDLFTPKEE